MKVTRREAIKVGAAGAVAAGIAYRVAGLPGLTQILEPGPTPPVRPSAAYVPSVCLQCPAGCGILVRVVDGRAVKIEGNPLHPINEGRLCPKGQIGLQILYDPDRIREPFVRPDLLAAYESGTLASYLATTTHVRTPGDFVPVPGASAGDRWTTAIDIAAAVLRTIRTSPGPQAVAFFSGRNRGQMGDVIGRFCTAYGTPNNIGHSSICADGSQQAHWATQGWKAYAGYDLDRTNYFLSFGGGFLEAWRPTTRLLRAYGTMHRGRPIRGKIVQVDVRFSVTAGKADEWIAIRPTTDGALAMGLAHVILRDGLYDAAFVADHTFGFDAWTDPVTSASHEGWRDFVLREYSPEIVAAITGVPADTIERIAREFATTKPAIAAGERGSSMQTNGVYNRMAIHALNALVGSVDREGGVLFQRNPPYTGWPANALDAVATAGLAQPRVDFAGTEHFPLAGKVYQGVPDFLLGRADVDGERFEAPYPLKAILTYYTNPLFSTPDATRWEEAIATVPFVLTFSPFLDETTSMADLVLPDRTYLERYHDDTIYPSLGYPVVGLRQPVVTPLHNTLDTGTALIRIAQAIGGTVADSFPWADFEALMKARHQGLFTAGGFVGDVDVATIRDFDAFWAAMKAKGVWRKPPYTFEQWSASIPTPSGRFEFFSENLHDKLEHLAEDRATAEGVTVEEAFEEILTELRIEARGDAVFFPHFEPPRFVGDAATYPLVLVTYKLMTHAEGRGANVRLLQDLTGPAHGNYWETWIEIDPRDARTFGISDGEIVTIESSLTDGSGRPRSITARARVFPGVPGVVAMPFELGHTAYGRWARDRGANPNRILANAYDRLGGNAAFSATRVRVFPAGGA